MDSQAAAGVQHKQMWEVREKQNNNNHIVEPNQLRLKQQSRDAACSRTHPRGEVLQTIY